MNKIRLMPKRNMLTGMILFAIIISFIGVDWEKNTLHNQGMDTLLKLLSSATSPDLSVLVKGIEAAVVTVVYATVGISIAIVIGMILGILSSGYLTQNSMIIGISKNISAFTRGVHELIWALFFVSAIGLTPFSAVFALAIPYGGMLGKVYADIFKSSNQEKMTTFHGLGWSPLQKFLYFIFPEKNNDLVSYTLYRYECAIRSTTILSFVGVGGLGYKIRLALDDLAYQEMFTYIYILVALVVIIDLISKYIQNQIVGKKSVVLGLIITMTSAWSYFFLVEGAKISQLLSMKNLSYAFDFLGKLLGASNPHPAYFDLDKIINALGLVVETLQMSVIAISITSILMLATVIGATNRYSSWLIRGPLRVLYLFTRAIPELVWAMIIIFVFKPGIVAGALALAIHNYGILSKLCSETIDNLNQGPLLALQSSGANKLQLLTYGVLPMAIDRIRGYIIYRWEIILRTTIVVGIVGAGGLGYYFRYAMSLFHYTDVTLVIILYLVLVKIADGVAETMIKIYD